MTHHRATVYQGDDEQWYWRVQAANNEIVSEGEGYTERAHAIAGLRSAHPEFAEADLSVGQATVDVE